LEFFIVSSIYRFYQI